ncbi:hypothetical protein BK764_04725 [Bacillus thuringiensis serovar israelensis]|uniref:Uncharacterized protein n=1 Tax=Bacillus thuringiensis TaxID=1428 RepID=A0AB35PKR7_BACTU|nr:hypothetical protein DN406_29560 [Bacillus sp. BB56-3]KAA8489470.1 hypothetical protein FYW98_05740 [Bacillus thuringiensis]OTX61307.1 hypothetical protein BK719_23055 [Bacillus thuringiensis serovar novosibirsk]OTZ59778.1 hypothetical protein BK764_04725 [Bacillus thuringiensis serovar israelensis]MDE4529072.1 hypothetical protein [Bacillus thuringiensis]
MQYEGIKKTSYGKIRGHQEDKNVVFETREFLINIITQYIYIFNIYIKARDICSKNTRNINLEQYVLFF